MVELMDRRWITPTQAVEFALREYGIRLTPATVRNWCARHRIGRQIGGCKHSRWAVDKLVFADLLLGEFGADRSLKDARF